MSSFMSQWRAALIASQERKAALKVCPRCDTEVWTGLDNDVMAAAAVADAEPVSIEEGFRAVLNGLDTYSLMRGEGGGKELNRREEWHYAETRWPCLVEHRCPEEYLVQPPQETRRAAVRAPAPVSRREQRQTAKAEREAAAAARTTRRRRAS